MCLDFRAIENVFNVWVRKSQKRVVIFVFKNHGLISGCVNGKKLVIGQDDFCRIVFYENSKSGRFRAKQITLAY